jgi:hypothetical protein
MYGIVEEWVVDRVVLVRFALLLIVSYRSLGDEVTMMLWTGGIGIRRVVDLTPSDTKTKSGRRLF